MPLPWKVATLHSTAPDRYLPHRFPFLLLDRVLEQQPGCSARARYRTSASLPAIPQTLLLEVLAQVSGLATQTVQGEGGFLASLDQARFGRPPEPGETLEAESRVLKVFGRLCLLEGRVTASGDELLHLTLTLGTGPL